jgi:hypothetical protein
MTQKFEIDGKSLLLVDNLLTVDEAKSFIKMLESVELHRLDNSLSVYDRHIMISDEWAKKIYARVIGYFPEDLRPQLSINDHFRFSKYHPGGYFRIHTDGINVDSKSGKRSFITINIFLNDDFEGGETSFYNNSGDHVVTAKPIPGRGAIFDRAIHHSGNTVVGGYKYLIRTDVMI